MMLGTNYQVDRCPKGSLLDVIRGMPGTYPFGRILPFQPHKT